MNISCLIVDDEPLAHRVILNYAMELHDLSIDGQAFGPSEALRLTQQQAFDIIFLDIEMPKMSGLEWLGLADLQAQIIITSAYAKYALQGYEYNVADYLLKPFSLSRFIKAVDQARKNIADSGSNADSTDIILLKADNKIYQLTIDEITHLESYGNYIKVHLTTKTLLTLKTMVSLVRELPQGAFIKTHKSYWVNRTSVLCIEGNSIVMKSGARVPLSRQHKADFLKYIKYTQ